MNTILQIKNDTDRLNINEYYFSKDNKYILEIKNKSNTRERCINNDGEEYYSILYIVNVYNNKMKLLGENIAIPFDNILSNNINTYLNNKKYIDRKEYFGNISIKSYQAEYKIWKDMISKVLNYNDKCFPYVGAIGTRICDRWLCFEYFYADLLHMHGYKEALKDIHYRQYVVDIYDTQKHINPCNRVYGPGLCKLKKFKDSETYKYLNNTFLNSQYPFNRDIIIAANKNQININKIFDSRRTGINDIEIDESNYYKYNPGNTQYEYLPKNIILKEMCRIIK